MRVEAAITPLALGGEAGARLVAWHDITDRVEGERARREAEALEAVRELARAAAHEINNPLAAIALYVEALRRPDLSPRQREDSMRGVEAMVFRIRDIVERLAHITRREIDTHVPAMPMLDIRRSSEPDPPAARRGDTQRA